MTITKTGSGLLLYDDFDPGGPAQDAVGNGWTENESLASDLRLFASPGGLDKPGQDNVTDTVERADLGLDAGDDLIVTANVQLRATTNDGIPGLIVFRTNGDFYDLEVRDATNQMFVRDVVGGSVQSQNTGALSVAQPNAYQVRLVIERSGVDTLLRGYAVGGGTPTTLASATVIKNGDFTLVVSHTDVGGAHGGATLELSIHDKGAMYEVLVCPRGVQVSGLPTGWKARLDGGASFVESGGVATIDVDARELPGELIEVLDDLDVVQDSLSRSAFSLNGRQGANGEAGDIVGGDTFSFVESAGGGGLGSITGASARLTKVAA